MCSLSPYSCWGQSEQGVTFLWGWAQQNHPRMPQNKLKPVFLKANFKMGG